MSSYYSAEAFIFKKEDRLESDRVFSVFTKESGRAEISGKAIRKMASKLRGGMEIFSLAHIEFVQGKNRKTLTDAMTLRRPGRIYASPAKLALGYEIADLIDIFIKGQQADAEIFQFLEDVFLILEQSPDNNPILQMLFWYAAWNFAHVLGYAPELSHCASCRQKLNPYSLSFSPKEGGIICKWCSLEKREGVRITSDTVKTLRVILQKDWGLISRLKIGQATRRQLREITKSYCEYIRPGNFSKSGLT